MHHTSAAPTSAAASAPPAHGGIAAAVGGDAAATGTNTLAVGEVTNKVENLGGATIASGEAVFAAEGTGSGAKASAYSGVSVTGADYVFEITVNEHGGSGSTAWAESMTKYVAIDIPGWNPPGGEKVFDTVVNLPYMPGPPPPGQSLLPSGSSGLPSGNVADDTVTADVLGHNTLVDISQHALATHNFSAVSAWALVAA